MIQGTQKTRLLALGSRPVGDTSQGSKTFDALMEMCQVAQRRHKGRGRSDPSVVHCLTHMQREPCMQIKIPGSHIKKVKGNY
jgi:hypothetical protein